jgi:amino acid transporter
VGSVGAWLTSVARLPYVAGIDHFLPPAFGRLHPRWGTPYVGLLVQTAGAAVFVILGQAGTSVRGAYDALNSMAVIVYFVPYLIMFAAAIRLRGEAGANGAPPSMARRAATVTLGALGFATTMGSIVLALLPSEGGGDPAMQVVRVVGLSGLLVASGAVLYWKARRSTR